MMLRSLLEAIEFLKANPTSQITSRPNYSTKPRTFRRVKGKRSLSLKHRSNRRKVAR